MSFAAIDILNDVVLGVGSVAACEEFVRVACVEAKNNGQPYSDEDTPSVSDFSDMTKYYQDLVMKHCEEKGIGLDGWDKQCREEVVAAVEAASLCCPEQVCDAVLAVWENGGDWQDELAKAIRNDKECAKGLGIE